MNPFTRAATAASAIVLIAGTAAAQDCNANGIDDLDEITNSSQFIDFEEGTVADLTNNSGDIGTLTSGSLNFTVTNQCFSGAIDDTPFAACDPGNVIIAFTNPTNCDFNTGTRESGFFFFSVTVNAGEDAILRFCTRYQGEGGSWAGSYDGGGQWAGGFDNAGVVVFTEADTPFNNPLASLPISTPGGVLDWEQKTLDLTPLGPGTYRVVFGFDSRDSAANTGFGLQVDNIEVLRSASNRDFNDNDLPDDCDTFVYNETDDQFFSTLGAALNSSNFDTPDNILATPFAVDQFNIIPRGLEATNLASTPAPLGSPSNGTDFTIPAGGTLTINNDNILDNVNFGGWIADGGEFRVEPGSFAEIQDPVDVINGGTLTINSGATLSTTSSADIISGTLNLLGGTADLGFDLDIGQSTGDPAVAQGFGTYTGNVDINATGQLLVQANTQIVNDLNIFSGGNVTVQNGTLTVFGGLNNNGTIVGDAVVPISDNLRAAGARNTTPGIAAIGNVNLGPNASLLTPNPDFILKVAGNFDVEIPVGPALDLSQSELRLNAASGNPTFEALATDLGPSPDGLDPALAGNEPIGTLRVGPTPTTAAIVDNNDNDGVANTEVLYVSNLVVEAAATLDATNTIIYYENLINNGTIITPANVIPIDFVTACPGDTDGDNLVGLDDLLTVLGNFGNAVAGGPADGDVDPVGAPDGIVGLDDLLTILGNFGNTCP